MNLNQLRYFNLLSCTLHYQRTAEQLGISQPALSRSIHALEEELGTQLFDRSRRTVVLSECGQEFARHIRTAMREIELGTEAVHEYANPQQRPICISATFGLSTTLIPPLARDYRAQCTAYPASFQLRQDSSPGILENLRSGISELGFTSYLNDQPDIEFEPVLLWDVCLVVPREHALAARGQISLAEAANYPMIFSVDKTYYLENLFSSRGLKPTVTMRLEEDTATASMVANGFGFSILPQNDRLKAYGVEQVPFSDSGTYRTYYMAHMRTHPLSRQAKDFRRFVLCRDLRGYVPGVHIRAAQEKLPPSW